MNRALLLLPLTLLGCDTGNPENNPVCGISAMAGAAMVLEQFGMPGKVLREVPSGVEGAVPARVVGYGTARALAGFGPDGLILGYEGEGSPGSLDSVCCCSRTRSRPSKVCSSTRLRLRSACHCSVPYPVLPTPCHCTVYVCLGVQ
jgi:hypothetical protein